MAESIKATINIELRPWRAPQFAQRTSEGSEATSISVKELDDATLSDMALAWLRDLYRNAGRTHVPFRKPEEPNVL